MRPDDKPAETYSPAARMFHWITFGAVAVMVPLGPLSRRPAYLSIGLDRREELDIPIISIIVEI